MATKQLNTLLKFEQEKAHALAQEMSAAESEYQQHQQRLRSVADYRLEYMKRLTERSLAGIDSATYAHFHAFIAKLDNASEQLELAIRQAQALLQQKKQQWLAQRRKVQAVELLLDKKYAELQRLENKREQKMFDEIATQQFVRRHMLDVP